MLRPDDIKPGFMAARVSYALRKMSENADSKKAWLSDLALEINEELRTVKSWYFGEACPHGDSMARLVAFLGARFVTFLLEPHNIVAYRKHDEAAVKAAELQKFVRNLPAQLHGLAEDAEALVKAKEEAGKRFETKEVIRNGRE